MTEISDPESTLRSEVTWAWFGTDEEIIDYLDFEWVRLQPQDDEPPWGLSYVDDQETHYACRSRDLICALGGPISVVTLALMYRESMLKIAGEGPISCQDDFDYLERTELDLVSPSLHRVTTKFIWQRVVHPLWCHGSLGVVTRPGS